MNRARTVIVLVMVDCASRHSDRCVSDPRGDGRSSVPASQEGELDGSLCASWNCGSTAMADRGDSGGPGRVGGGKEACQGRRASCGSRNRPGVLAITKAGKPCTTKGQRQSASIAKKGQRAYGDCQER